MAKPGGLQVSMSDGTTLNLATVGTAELEAMSVPVFASCLDTMSGDAIKRFKKMRKLSASHRSALEKHLIEHPEKLDGMSPPAPTRASIPDGQNKMSREHDRRGGFADFKRRLKAWWEGEVLKEAKPTKKAEEKKKKTPKPKPAAAKPVDVVAPAPAQAAVERRPAFMNKAEMLEMLWGEGYELPGGATFAQKLRQNAKLVDGERCLDITAGLAGDACALAQHHKITIEALECDAELMGNARATITKAGLEDAVILSMQDAATTPFANQTYAAVFAREKLFTLPDREKLMANIAPALCPNGMMIITDFMLAERSSDNEVLKDWHKTEPVMPIPLTQDEYNELFVANGLTVDECNDLSEDYIRFIHEGWKRLHSFLQTAKLSPETAAMLITEGNMWLGRCKMLEAGQLRLINMVGTLRPE